MCSPSAQQPARTRTALTTTQHNTTTQHVYIINIKMLVTLAEHTTANIYMYIPLRQYSLLSSVLYKLLYGCTGSIFRVYIVADQFRRRVHQSPPPGLEDYAEWAGLQLRIGSHPGPRHLRTRARSRPDPVRSQHRHTFRGGTQEHTSQFRSCDLSLSSHSPTVN